MKKNAPPFSNSSTSALEAEPSPAIRKFEIAIRKTLRLSEATSHRSPGFAYGLRSNRKNILWLTKTS